LFEKGDVEMIRKFCCFLVCAFLVSTGAYSSWAQDEGENLVQNPDFENPTQAPWYHWVEDASAVAMLSIDDEESFTGDQSLLIEVSKKGNGQRVELHQDPFILESGQQMTYAFWAKVGKDDLREANMIVNHREDPWTTYGSASIRITEEWIEFHTSADISADDDMVGIYVELRDTVGKVWFDHFRFYEGDYEEEDMEEMEKDIAVEPRGKVACAWARIKEAR
jgi:hypothetical protein